MKRAIGRVASMGFTFLVAAGALLHNIALRSLTYHRLSTTVYIQWTNLQAALLLALAPSAI
jgi:hypothetical protein